MKIYEVALLVNRRAVKSATFHVSTQSFLKSRIKPMLHTVLPKHDVLYVLLMRSARCLVFKPIEMHSI